MTTWFVPVGISSYEDREDLTAIPLTIRSLWGYVEDAFQDPSILDELGLDDGVWDHRRLAELFGNTKVAGSLAKARPSDTVIVYWAGHGFMAGEHRLALSTIGDSILTRELADWLFNCAATTILCILDCCDAGAGLQAISDLAVSLKQAEAPEPREHRRMGLIASGRNEDTTEGALVTTMLKVLRRGPQSGLDTAHSWDASVKWIRADQLVAAINHELGEEQQAIADDLRDLSLGAFFPSAWHQQGARNRLAPIPPDSFARRDTERLLYRAGMQPPAAWTEEHLTSVAMNLPSNLPIEIQQQVKERIRALRLAQSAQTLVRRLVDRTRITSEMLVTARWAATGADGPHLFETEFDFFHDASTERVSQSGATSAARTLSFVARLVYDVDSNADHHQALFEWAHSNGLSEGYKVNEIIARAQAPRGEAVLVIDLRNPPDVAAIDAFPLRAEGSLVDHESGPGPSESVPIARQDPAGVAAAVAELISRFRRRRVTSIHLLVPDQLLLFDAAAVEVPLHPRHKVAAGERYDVRVHCDRTEDDRFDTFGDHYRDAVADPLLRTHYDNCAAADKIIDLWRKPPALIFRFPVAAESAETLINAIWTSPIVIWPVTEPNDRDKFVEDLDREWPDIPRAARSARWLNNENSEHLGQMRLFWDDPDWLRLLKENYDRRA